MAEPTRKSALEGYVSSGTRGRKGEGGPGVTLRERRPAGIAQVHGCEGDAERARVADVLGLAPAAGRASEGEGLLALWNAPGSWLAITDTHDPASLCALLRESFDGTSATVTDLSHARTVVEIRGNGVRELLAGGCPMDVDAMRPGDTAATLLGPFTVQLHCRDDGIFDVYAMRSFAVALWEMLVEEAADLGCTIDA